MDNTLPAFYYPTTWVYVDDDVTLLKTIGTILNEHNKTELFQSPEECISYLTNYKSPLSNHSFLKSVKNDENYGLLQSAPMDFNVTQLASLAEDENNHKEITVAIIDYNMPGMNGFELAKKIQALPIQKILLTGNKEDSKAIEGFNKSLIQRFVQKSTDRMVDKLYLYLKELSVQYFRNASVNFLAYLETERKMPLSDPSFIDFFETYQQDNNISEYYLIDKEGSFLCVDKKGKKTCLIVRTSQSIDAWLNIYENQNVIPETDLALIKKYKKVPFFGVGKEAWQIESSEWSQHLYSPKTLEGRETYLIFNVAIT